MSQAQDQPGSPPHLGSMPRPFPGSGLKQRIRGRQADRHHDLHRLQGVRGRLSGVNSLTSATPPFRTVTRPCRMTTVELLELIKFNEYEPEGDGGNLMLLMRKDQCMHCEEPGCLIACPLGRRHRAVRQRHRRLPLRTNAIRLRLLHHPACPFNIPKMSPKSQKGLQVHALRRPASPRVWSLACIKACPTGLPALRHQGRDEGARREPSLGSCASSRASPHMPGV